MTPTQLKIYTLMTEFYQENKYPARVVYYQNLLKVSASTIREHLEGIVANGYATNPDYGIYMPTKKKL
jgi:Mn-dependent DtxR family transcriptional regulator